MVDPAGDRTTGASGGALSGRSAELNAVETTFDRAVSRASLCVAELIGDAGIGKSAILGEFVDRARSRPEPPVTLVARCAAAEEHLAYAVLRDLLDSVRAWPSGRDDELRELVALVAPAGVDGPGTARDEALVGSRLMDLVRDTATEHPVLVVIDDVQWCDHDSRSALSYALRRLPRAPVALVTACRPDTAGVGDLGLPSTIVDVGPLDEASIRQIISDVAPDLADRMRAEIARASGGHALFAVELAHHAAASPTTPGRLPGLPRSLDEAVTGRLRQCSPAAQRTSALLALCGSATLAVIEQLSLSDALAELERADVVDTVNRRIEFTHPLLANAASRLLSPVEVRRLHRLVAEHLPSDDERARHRALGADTPDERLAADVADVAAAAAARGDFANAAEHALLAVAVSPDASPRRVDRAISAARLAHRTGRTVEARRLIDEILDGSATTGDQRSQALIAGGRRR